MSLGGSFGNVSATPCCNVAGNVSGNSRCRIRCGPISASTFAERIACILILVSIVPIAQSFQAAFHWLMSPRCWTVCHCCVAQVNSFVRKNSCPVTQIMQPDIHAHKKGGSSLSFESLDVFTSVTYNLIASMKLRGCSEIYGPKYVRVHLSSVSCLLSSVFIAVTDSRTRKEGFGEQASSTATTS
jgi:hypothetical protein